MNIRFTILLLLGLLILPSFAFAAKTHKVKKNETLTSLANKYHVSVNDLKEANNKLNSSIKPGELLVIPSQSASRKNAAETSARASVYKVRKGDSISRISKRTGVSVAEIKRLNDLGNNKLKTGQILALVDPESESSVRAKVASRPPLRYIELLNEKEYEQSLTELIDQDTASFGIPRETEKSADSVKLLKTKAFGFLGTRYRFGGSTQSGIDCSAFVQKVFNEMDISLPRTAREQFERGEIVNQGDMQKGDLVFFRTYASFPSHVGIYLGNNRMIHASSRDKRVVISSLNTPYYRARFIGAKRIARISPDRFNLDELLLDVEEEAPEDTQKNDLLGLTSSNLN